MVGYFPEFIVLHFDESFCRRGTVDRIYHYFARIDASVGIDESVDFGRGGVVDGATFVLAAKEHRLHDTLGTHRCYPVDNVVYVVGFGHRAVKDSDCGR